MGSRVTACISLWYKYTTCVLLFSVMVFCQYYTRGPSRWSGYQRASRSPGSGYSYSQGRYGNNQYQTSRWRNYEKRTYSSAPGSYSNSQYYTSSWNNFVRKSYSSSPGRYGKYQNQYTSKYKWNDYPTKNYYSAQGQYQNYYTRSPTYASRNAAATSRSSWSDYRRTNTDQQTTKDYSNGDSELIVTKASVKQFNKVPIFYNRDTIMDVFDVERVGHDSLVSDMMATYEHVCLAKPDVPTPPPMKRKPFIVIEGNHAPSRKVLAERLAQRLAGRMMSMTRKCLEPYLQSFPRGTKLRRAFFGLALYASEYKVRQLWDRSLSVVMDGYWWDQSAHVIAWLFGSRNLPLPAAGNRIYSWPVDLMEPDVIFYLKVPDKAMPNPPPKWMSLVPQVYQKIKHPKVVIVEPKEGVNRTAEAMQQYINKYLQGKRDLSCTTPLPPDSVHNDEYGELL